MDAKHSANEVKKFYKFSFSNYAENKLIKCFQLYYKRDALRLHVRGLPNWGPEHRAHARSTHNELAVIKVSMQTLKYFVIIACDNEESIVGRKSLGMLYGKSLRWDTCWGMCIPIDLYRWQISKQSWRADNFFYECCSVSCKHMKIKGWWSLGMEKSFQLQQVKWNLHCAKYVWYSWILDLVYF